MTEKPKYLYIYDLTLKWTEKLIDNDIVRDLKKIAKKWGFQQEIGESTGYRHYQIRLSLIKKTTESRLRNILKDTCLAGAHTSITSNGCEDIYYYTTKLDTRVPGTSAYTDKDPEPPKLTSQLYKFMEKELDTWMSQLFNIMTTPNLREITFIYDPTGNKGKSLFTEWCEYKGVADEVPFFNSYEDISAYVCSRRTAGYERGCYMVDLPRGIRKNKLAEFYAGIESLKNGVCFDKRHKATKLRFDRPQIVIFTNKIPEELECLSKDRWKIYCINNELLQLTDITAQILGYEDLEPGTHIPTVSLDVENLDMPTSDSD